MAVRKVQKDVRYVSCKNCETHLEYRPTDVTEQKAHIRVTKWRRCVFCSECKEPVYV